MDGVQSGLRYLLRRRLLCFYSPPNSHNHAERGWEQIVVL
jgi:hypothetical protein